jgi:2-oxoglutarate dehydrogenase E2 component (dihydrolipoamide succinyltransferase)
VNLLSVADFDFLCHALKISFIWLGCDETISTFMMLTIFDFLLYCLSFFFWHAVPGDFVQADEVVARIETDKVTVDILAPESGIIKEYFAEEGETVLVGAKFYVLDTDGKPGAAAPKTPAAAEPVATQKAASVPQPAAAAPKQTPAPTKPVAPAGPAPTGGSSVTTLTAKKAPITIVGTRTETRVQMNRMRLRIADRLKEA